MAGETRRPQASTLDSYANAMGIARAVRGTVSRLMILAILCSAAVGCSSTATEATLRDVVPTVDALTFPVPGAEDAGRDGARVEPLLGQRAVLYQVTRDTVFVVNGSVLLVMGALQLVLATPPSLVTEQSARWGPFEDRERGIVYELDVESLGIDNADGFDRFRFVLRGGTSEQEDWEYVDVLSGVTELGAAVRRGTISFDFDAFASLRPVAERGPTGRIAARWDTGPFLAGSGPRRLDVTFDRFAGSEDGVVLSATYRFEQFAPRAGRLFLETIFDLVKTTSLPERVAMVSRWNEDGGRADARASGGDLSLLSFGLVECWGPRFGRTYYRDTLDAEPEEGVARSCVFIDADEP